MLKTKKMKWGFALTAILIYLMFYFPVPYFIAKPGQALELDTIIEVDGGYSESGELMLTSVSMYSGNISTLIYGKFNTFIEIIPKEMILNKDEDPKDYSKKQVQIMNHSQDNAIIAACNYLDLPIEVVNNGVLVLGILPNAPSKDKLEIGDLIIAADDIKIKELEDMLVYFQGKKESEVVKINFIRKEKEYSEEIPLINLKDNKNEKRVGLGINPFEARTVKSPKIVEFKTDDIGGPSAGLMFTLEIINQLIAEDLTKGYRIAGTGTIDSEGRIGQIGSARLKIKAAHENGAEIFFIPKDINDNDSNERDAIQANRDIGYPMEIVPVATLTEAIEYLNLLSKK